MKRVILPSLFIKIPQKQTIEEKELQQALKVCDTFKLIGRIDKIIPNEDLDQQIVALLPILLNVSPKTFLEGFWNNGKLDEEIYIGTEKTDAFNPNDFITLRSRFLPVLQQKIAENSVKYAWIEKIINEEGINLEIQDLFETLSTEIDSLPQRAESKEETDTSELSPSISESNSDLDEEDLDVSPTPTPSPTAIVSRGNFCWSEEVSSISINSPIHSSPRRSASPINSPLTNSEEESIDKFVGRANATWSSI